MASLDFKLDYMGRLFRKISHKPTEAYIIQRIWHRLDDDRVKFVLQQRVSMDNSRALIDLYLPQLGIAVEINEPYHLSEAQKKRDAVRNSTIERNACCQVEVIDCSQSLDAIHRKVDEIVDLIKKRVKEMGVNFIPWSGDDEMLPKYHKDLGVIGIGYNNCFRTIDDICETFDTKAIHNGFLRDGVAGMPETSETILWFPSVFSHKWENKLSSDGCYITEVCRDNNDAHYLSIMKDYSAGKLPKRITFYRGKDDLGFNYYKFVGVFELDDELTQNQQVVHWRRVCEQVELR